MPEKPLPKPLRLPGSTFVLLALVLIGLIIPFALSFIKIGLKPQRTHAQRAAFTQVEQLREHIKAVYIDAYSGKRLKKDWYQSLVIPPEVVVVDYGEENPALALLYARGHPHSLIPVLYRIPDDKPYLAYVLLASPEPIVLTLSRAELTARIETTRTTLAATKTFAAD